MKITLLLVLIMLMLHAQFAIAHFFSGQWFVLPLNISITIIMIFHAILIVSEFISKNNRNTQK